MTPYRSAPAAIVPRRPRSWLARLWTRFKRRLALFGRGTWKDRFPDRCDICGKPSRKMVHGGDVFWIQSTYSECGHEYHFWRRLRESAHRDDDADSR